ncbi:MAG: Hsp70 family protein [Deltaproteobacteria bacterium]|nr:Hsp70 family protein [Deltaproteobacteria bacterium]
MTTTRALHLGIDLGTTNSTAAIFDGDQVTLVRNASGSTLTPSVVRLDARGNVTVGAKARRFLDSDPQNARAEFKRLMGTDAMLEFAAAGQKRSPVQLSAEVLRALRVDVREQTGVEPMRAVVTVPALFEVPQSAATADAARLAGFEKVELLQEPVASALAAGWTRDDEGRWLVYDLGGGTFDVSLLETRDGMLRVVSHDGDNFLGGRDVDWAIVDWALGQLTTEVGRGLSRADPALAPAVRRLKAAAEEAKMEATRGAAGTLVVPELDLAGTRVDVDLQVSAELLETLAMPLVRRSVDVCQRLLATEGAGKAPLTRVVLVGGPTVMPFLRRAVKDALGAPLAEGLDPMTLVAHGAALYAGTAGLDMRAPEPVAPHARPLWLKYPAVSTDLKPYVVGRVTDDASAGPAPVRLGLVRDDGWKSDTVAVGADGAFVLALELLPRRRNVFRVEATGADGAPVAVHPSELAIVQGLTITDPPLSRAIGVALANNRVRVFFDRGTPLPARRTLTLHTVESVARGHVDSILRIPIIQGEYDHAHLCRLVGALDIGGQALRESLPLGSGIEVTLELDRGGRLGARALVPSSGQVFEGVAHLLVPEADVSTLEELLRSIRARVARMRQEAFLAGTTTTLARLVGPDAALADIARDLAAAHGGDADAAQRARRSLQELEAALEEMDTLRRWPELLDEARRKLAWTAMQVSDRGTPQEKRLLGEVEEAVERARQGRQMLEMERQLHVAMDLGNAAWFRNPEHWVLAFEDAEAEVERATDLPKAQVLVQEGRKAVDKEDYETVKEKVRALWRLLPPEVAERRQGFDSGVR